MAARRTTPRRDRGPVEPNPPVLATELDDVVLDLHDPSDLRNARITEVVGEGDIDDLEVIGCTLEGVALTAVSARRLRLTDVVLRGCELSGIDLTEARFRRVRLEGCRAAMLDVGMAAIEDLVVVDCKLTEAGLRMATIERSRFEGCDMVAAELGGARLDAVTFDGCDLTGADVAGASMQAVRFPRSALDELRGAPSLAGASVDPAQVLPVALALFGALGIGLEDPEAELGAVTGADQR